MYLLYFCPLRGEMGPTQNTRPAASCAGGSLGPRLPAKLCLGIIARSAVEPQGEKPAVAEFQPCKQYPTPLSEIGKQMDVARRIGSH